MTAAALHDQFAAVLGTGRGRPDIQTLTRQDRHDATWGRLDELLDNTSRSDLLTLVQLVADTDPENAEGEELVTAVGAAALGRVMRATDGRVVQAGWALGGRSAGYKLPGHAADKTLEKNVPRALGQFVAEWPAVDALEEAAAQAWREALIGCMATQAVANPQTSRLDYSARPDTESTAEVREAAREAAAVVYDLLIENRGWTASHLDELNGPLFEQTRCRILPAE